MAGELLSLEDALELVLAHATPLPHERVPLASAHGRHLAEPAVAEVDLPPFPSSAMDGYAVRAAETPGTFGVAFRVAAGHAPRTLPAGSAAGIATGAVVPDGADAVVPVELARGLDGQVELPLAQPGAHIRLPGGDVRAGDVVLDTGAELGPPQVGALAAAGVAAVRCHARPQVAVLATGSELRSPGEPLEPGQIYESNRPMLAALLQKAGADVDLLAVAVDDEAAHRDAMSRGLEANVLVTSGGVSVGPHDLVRKVGSTLGVAEVFWGVAVKPGKPVFFGIRGSTLVFGLPGNPVSALVSATLFVLPALRVMQGARDPGPPFELGRLATTVARSSRDVLARARRRNTSDGVELELVQGQDSHMIVRAAAADALVHVPRGDGELRAGDPVRYLLL